MFNGDEVSSSISPAGHGQLIILIILEPHGIFQQILLTYALQHFLATCMQNGDEALPVN